MTTNAPSVPCSQCGAAVPEDRAGYSWPMCLACLPAPSQGVTTDGTATEDVRDCPGWAP